ncbi:MAG: flagellar brake protein [Rubrivivax sp.]|nr:flagellar brake protein [Rubrivivax sp.]
MMFQDTRPAQLDCTGGEDPWASFRVVPPQACLTLLRALCNGQVPLNLNGPDGSVLSTTLWSVDAKQQRLSFSAPPDTSALDRLVEAGEAVAVAYIDSVKLQFDIDRLLLVQGAQACALHSAMPASVLRFQRRQAWRVRPTEREALRAYLRHPAVADLPLALRVLDLSIGGCALWQPPDQPPLQAGTRIADVIVKLDGETQFRCGLILQHVAAVRSNSVSDSFIDRVTDSGLNTSADSSPGGVRLGCEWLALGGAAERTLQRWIDQMQKRRRHLALG